jgi:energy-coupling factor transporter ATP-binding protein EcfA2
MLQRPGKKAQWAVILQGAKGNGKTTLIKILNHAISDRYVHIQDALDLGNKFNIWMRDKLLIVIDELKVPRRKQTKFMTRLKPLITNDRIAVQGKGKDQTVIDNRANFFMATNHKDAIPITENNRRFCMLAAAQQDKKDLERDGLTKQFFLKLYGWLNQNNKEGFDIINEYLMTYNLKASEFNFDVCIDAPVTSVTPEIIELSRSPLENVIREAFESEKIGFKGGWASSYHLNSLFRLELSNTESMVESRTNKARLRKILKKIGYVPHPGLIDGRASFIIDSDGKTRPTLYVKEDSPFKNLTDRLEIKKAYEGAQGTN